MPHNDQYSTHHATHDPYGLDEPYTPDDCTTDLHTIRHALGLSTTAPSDDLTTLCHDVVFVAIDTEGDPTREIGIATLDTRDLAALSLSPSSDLNNVIKASNFRIWKHEKHERSRAFRFVLRTGSTDLDITEDRNTILVTHDFRMDFIIMNRRANGRPGKGRLRPEELPVELILDTSRLPPTKIGTYSGLRKLLQMLKIPHTGRGLHCAGNDANLLLKVMLMQGVKSCVEEELSEEQKERKTLVEALANTPFPEPLAWEDRNDLAGNAYAEDRPRDEPVKDWTDMCDGVMGLLVGIKDAMAYR